MDQDNKDAFKQAGSFLGAVAAVLAAIGVLSPDNKKGGQTPSR